MRALEDEAESLRQLHAEARQMADEHASSLQEMQDRHLSMEKQQTGLRSELTALRSQLAVALQEAARLKDSASSKDLEHARSQTSHRGGSGQVESAQAVHGGAVVSVPNDDELSVKSGYADRRIRELEEEIDARAREVQEAEHRLQDSESRVEELTRELEHTPRSLLAVAPRTAPVSLRLIDARSLRSVSLPRRRLRTGEDGAAGERLSDGGAVCQGYGEDAAKDEGRADKYKTENASLHNEVATLRELTAAGE